MGEDSWFAGRGRFVALDAGRWVRASTIIAIDAFGRPDDDDPLLSDSAGVMFSYKEGRSVESVTVLCRTYERALDLANWWGLYLNGVDPDSPPPAHLSGKTEMEDA